MTRKKPSNDQLRQEQWNRVKDNIAAAAAQAGIDPGVLARIANYESGFNSDARPIAEGKREHLNTERQFDGKLAISTAHGLGQFLDGTWTDYINKYGQKYGISGAGIVKGKGKLSKEKAAAYRQDIRLQAAMLAEFTRENMALGRQLGGNDDNANIYALHNLGGKDGKTFLAALKANPQAQVKSIGLKKSVIPGNSDLYGNGTLSVAEVYQRMGKKMASGDRFANEISQSQSTVSQAEKNKKPTTPATAQTIQQNSQSIQGQSKAAGAKPEKNSDTVKFTEKNESASEALLAQRQRFSQGYQYKYGGTGKKNALGVKEIDCSNLVNQMLKGSGYDLPYQNTAALDKSKYFDEIDAKDVKPGDIALWRGKQNHTGVIERYDPKTSKGTFFGSQSSTGPASAKMGNGTYWKTPTKFLRPKPEYRKQIGDATDTVPTTATPPVLATPTAAKSEPAASPLHVAPQAEPASAVRSTSSSAPVSTAELDTLAGLISQLQAAIAQLGTTAQQLAQPPQATVDVPNGNLAAAVNHANQLNARRS